MRSEGSRTDTLSLNSQPNHRKLSHESGYKVNINQTHSPVPNKRQVRCIDFDETSKPTNPPCGCRKLLTHQPQKPNHCYYCEQQQQQQQQQTQQQNHPPVKKTSLDTSDYLQVFNTLPNNYFCDQNQQKQLQLCLGLDQPNIRKNSSHSIRALPDVDIEGRHSEEINNNMSGANHNDSGGDAPPPPDEEQNSKDEIDLEIDLEQTYYPEKVFWCLKRKSLWRHWAIRITLSPYFERITIFVILMNCVTLGLYDPYDEDCQQKKCKVLEGFETFIYGYFVLEMLIKMIAHGIFGSLGYLSEGWNRLDFFIVIAGTFELVYGDGEFLSSVRAVRVLRPLRAINRVPSIRILVTLLLDTLPMLGNVFILCILILMVFAIIGVQLWHGILRNRCTLDIPQSMPSYFANASSYPTENYYIQPNEDPWSLICPMEDNKITKPAICRNEIPSLDLTPYNCSKIYGPFSNFSLIPLNETNCIDWNKFYTSCEDVGQNPQYGAISFDNSGEAFIAIFQAMTLEGWVDIMYFLQDAHSSWVWVYFVTLIVLGSYFLTNLCLVVVATQFSETRQRESALMEEARRKARSTSSTIFTSTDTENKGCYNQILSLLKHYIQRGCRRLKVKIFGEKSQQVTKRRKKKGRHLLQKEGGGGGRKRLHVNGGGDVHYHHHHHHHIHHHHLHLCNSNSMANATANATTNGDLNAYGEDLRYCPNAVSGVDKTKTALAKKNSNCTSNNLHGHGHAQTVPSSTTIRPAPPSIIIDEVNTCDLQPLPALPMNTTTALIIPDTTVVICHSSALQSQSPLTTVSLFPSLSKLHHRASMNEGDFENEQLCSCRYRSVGDPQCCTDISRDFDKYERDVLNDSDMFESDDCTDTDCESADTDREERKKRKWVTKKRKLIVQFCESDCFKVSIMTAIFLNTVTMAMEHYQQPESMTMALEIFNTIFTTVFLIEFVLKFTGYGFYGYIKNAFNVFDGIVVIISIIELAGSRAGGVSVLRTFRLMRIFKLIRFLPTLQKQIQVMLETLDSVMTFLGLLTIFIFTSSILGMHLFGGRMKDDDNEPVRHNFDDLLWSLITVFQVLTQEDWNAVLYDAMRSTSKWASVYFVLLMIIGNYILFNLLVAILVEGFSSETEGILSTPSKSPLLHNNGGFSPSIPRYQENSEMDIFDPTNKTKDKSQSMPNIMDESYYLADLDCKLSEEGRLNGFNKYRRMSSSESALHRQVRFNTEIKISPVINEYEDRNYYDNEDDEQMIKDMDMEEKRGCKVSFFSRRKDWSLYIFSPKNSLRSAANRMVSKPWFDNVVLFFILMNCLIMAVERPSIKPESTERQIIDISNHVFTIVFTIEMLIKIFAAGFYLGEKTTYLKNSWNRIDFVLVMISLVDIFVTYVVQSKSGVLGVLKVFRAFRTLRPLRVISRAPGLKIVVETLIHSLVPIGNLLIVGLVFFTIFGILGVQLFKGKFHYCNIEDESLLKLIISRGDCRAKGGTWTNKKYNFDNLFQALFTLFVFSTKDGWVSLMYDGIDAVGIDLQPKKNHNRWAFLYFVAFLLIAGFVVINMVVGVIIDNFQKCRILVEGEELEAGHTVSSSHPASDEDVKTFESISMNPLTNNSLQSLTTIASKTTLASSCGSHRARHVHRKILTQLEQNLAEAGVHTFGAGREKKVSFIEDQDGIYEDDEVLERSKNNKHYDVPKHLDEYSYARRKCYAFVSHYKFDLVIAVIIGLNVILMAIEHDKMSAKLVTLLRILNYIFTAIFILEAILKIWGFGPRMFFAQRWNQLDIVIVFLSIIGIIFEELNSELPINPTIIRIMRVLRIARVLKILKAADGIQKLLNCVTEAIPQVGNLSMLFLLIFFIYSALGIELFGDLDCDLDTCFGISRHAHFKNFGYALLTLFRVSTGDNWSGLLKDCINVKLCPEECPMMPYMAPVYYSTFVLASQFVLVNVVVAVLMKQLEDAKDLVSPSSSQASGLNSPLNENEKPIENKDDVDDKQKYTENYGDNLEMKTRRNEDDTQSFYDNESLFNEQDPLLPLDGNKEKAGNEIDDTLLSMNDCQETDFGAGENEFFELSSTPQETTNHEENYCPETSTTHAHDDNESEHDKSSNKNIDIENNNKTDKNEEIERKLDKNNEPTGENKNTNEDLLPISNSAKDNLPPKDDFIEETIKELIDTVIKNVTEQQNQNSDLDCLDVDILATVEALSGLRDSVHSTCV